MSSPLLQSELLDRVDEVGPEPAISDGSSVEQLLETRGWDLILRRIELLRQEAFYHVMAVGGGEGFPASHWRSRLAAFDEVIGLPQDYMRAKEIAMRQKEDDKAVTGILNPR